MHWPLIGCEYRRAVHFDVDIAFLFKFEIDIEQYSMYFLHSTCILHITTAPVSNMKKKYLFFLNIYIVKEKEW